MSLDLFSRSLSDEAPPPGLSVPLQALWWTAKGDWDRAHRLVQSDGSADGAWVHAHLHRVEGDEANAGYWYRQAGRPFCADGLKAEWTALVRALL
jgi:hypothetical protein